MRHLGEMRSVVVLEEVVAEVGRRMLKEVAMCFRRHFIQSASLPFRDQRSTEVRDPESVGKPDKDQFGAMAPIIPMLVVALSA